VLERIRIGLTKLQAIARGDAVAIADHERGRCGLRSADRQQKNNCNENGSAYVHVNSVRGAGRGSSRGLGRVVQLDL
jgi:hypothetical protein